MAAPTSIGVEVDRDEYSRFERDRDSVLVTLDVTGSLLMAEEIEVTLVKARRNRDIVVATKTVTLGQPVSHLTTVTFDLDKIIDETGVPKVRRGEYFVRATSVTDTDVVGESSDFLVSLVTIGRLKADYLHGTDQMATDFPAPLEQPRIITGVTIESLSQGHPKGAFTLSYNYAWDHIPTLNAAAGPYVLTDGMNISLVIDGATPVTATFNTADFTAIGAATAAEVAAAINADLGATVAFNDAGTLRLTTGTSSLVVYSGTAITALGFTAGQSDTATNIRLLSWCGGPSVAIVPGKRTYILQRGVQGGYVTVRVASAAALPRESKAEETIIDRKALDEGRMRAIVDQAISWVEDSAISVYLEPTTIITEIDAATIAFPSGSDIPEFVGADWDEIVDAVTYTSPTAGHWMNWSMPFVPLLEFQELYGKIGNTRILDVALEWVEFHERTGFVELVPFSTATAWNYIGLVWVDSLRGPVPLPNFWNFTARVGFRETPPVLLELVAKKAAMDLLTIAGQAFKAGITSQSVSRDGVSESVSYTASAQGGIYAGTISDYKKWIDDNIKKLVGAFRGPTMVVM